MRRSSRGHRQGTRRAPEPEARAVAQDETEAGEAFADETPTPPPPVSTRRARADRSVRAVAGDSTAMPSGARRRTMPDPPDEPRAPGYRTSKRASKSGKLLRKQAKTKRVRAEVGEKTAAGAKVLGRGVRIVIATAISVVLVVGLLWLGAEGINAFARWNARRLAEAGAASKATAVARENLVVIGAAGKQVKGFVALKAERSGKRVLGFSIPDGAFVEVPGQGFEAIGDSFAVSPVVSRDAVSNFLMVPFPRYVVVDERAFQRLVMEQSVAGLLDGTVKTDLSASEKAGLAAFFAGVSTKDVWIVPMPVKPIAVGDERYFEPQRAEIADLVLQWWGVRVEQQKQALRLIVYNGVGTPGVAGKAAQQLIRKGFRIVDSKNADNFKYARTRILLYHGTQAEARTVRDALGTGDIVVESAPQNIADIIVIIGSDYTPPAGS